MDVFPPEHTLFSTGRAALLTLGRLLKLKRGRRVCHLPSYFCPEVSAALESEFDLAWYRDLPNEQAPDLATLRPVPGDVVLAVNLFGMRDRTVWDDWRGDHGEIILVEDHTHDPLSLWAQRSTADYAFASLRKTLPIPDGAVVWSPRALILPKPMSPPPASAQDKLASMVLKRAYLRGADVPKEAYRKLQRESEQALTREIDSAASAFTSTILCVLDIAGLRHSREANARLFLSILCESRSLSAKPLFLAWPDGNVPYNPALVFKTGDQRDKFRRHLMSKNVYCPVHWQLTLGGVHSGDRTALDLSQRIMTVPVDHRCTPEDLVRIVEIMASLEGRASVS
ncbi:MAG: DegT/DnrJ/EryC1/StrS aminotransferase family protein [Acidimicrobiales bacterium]